MCFFKVVFRRFLLISTQCDKLVTEQNLDYLPLCWVVGFSGLCLERVIVVNVTADKCLFCQFQFEASRGRTACPIRIRCLGLSQETASICAECAYGRPFVCLAFSYLLCLFFPWIQADTQSFKYQQFSVCYRRKVTFSFGCCQFYYCCILKIS